jgi:hypothetical protein
MASVLVSVMSALHISSVVDPLGHLRRLPVAVAVANQVRGATIGLQHRELGEQAQCGLLANSAVSRWLSLDESSLSQTEQAMDRGILYAVSHKACQGLSVT